MVLRETFFAENLPDPRLERWKEQFDTAELRAMSPVGLTLRSLARSLRGTHGIEGGPATAIYAALPDSNPCIDTSRWRKELDPFDVLRLWPPKQIVGSGASMAASQVAIELRATGPIHCLLPSPEALDFLCDQAALDVAEGRVKSFALCRFDGSPDGGCMVRASVVFFPDPAALDPAELKKEMKRD